jgi:hypothetical protein
MTPYNIATFGCWNNKYNDDFYFLKKVVAEIIENNRIDNYKFAVILGDNYYPNKVKFANDNKYEIVLESEILEGFDILNKMELEKRIIFGNHDIVKVTKPLEDELQTEIINNQKNKTKLELLKDSLDKCSILEIEKSIDDGNKNKINFLFDFEITDDNSTLLLYIDTSIYDIVNEDNCYNDIYMNEHITSKQTIADLIKTQHKFIKDKITEFVGNNIIIFGHEPIITCKAKEGKNGKNNDKTSIISPLYNQLISVINKDVTYICADNHIHQKGMIKNKRNSYIIHQYVFGTGGTGLDISPTNNIYENENYTYIIDEPYHKKINDELISWRGVVKNNENMPINNNSTEEYGYGVVRIFSDSVRVEFKPIKLTLEEMQQRGGFSFFKYNKYLHKNNFAIKN